MSTIPYMEASNLPEDALRFFHGLSNWVESIKGHKIQLIEWEKGQKKLSHIQCVKPSQQGSLTIPHEMEDNTLYIPSSSSGKSVISNIRHAFCHNDLSYDPNSGMYQIKMTDKVHIAGKFTLESIQEFVNVYKQPNPQSKKKKDPNK